MGALRVSHMLFVVVVSKNDGVIDVIAIVVLFVAVVSNTMESMM